MLDWFKKKLETHMSVMFHGSLPPRVDELNLERHGITVTRHTGTGSSDNGGGAANGGQPHWVLQVSHPQWGKADIMAPRQFERPSELLPKHDPRLRDEDRAAIAAAGSHVMIRHQGDRGHILRDRKHALRFADALLGDDGIVAVDHTAQMFWTRPLLSDELAHDADLDITSIHTMHAVRDDGDPEDEEAELPVQWLHSHGLAEIGAFDYDILQPSDMMMLEGSCIRAISFAIVEGTLQRDTARFSLASPGGVIRLVPAAEFMRSAAPQFTALRDDPEGFHLENRSVICDCTGRWFWQKKTIRPSRFLSETEDDHLMFHMSRETTELMAERARKTLPLFRQFGEKLAELGCPMVVKIGVETKSGGREHMWFSVLKITDRQVRGRLENEPFDIPGLTVGDERDYAIEQIGDWTIPTPLGMITPNTTRRGHVLMEHFDQFAAAHRAMQSRG